MLRNHRFARLALATACAAGVLALASCSDSPTEPEPTPVVHRTVTVVVRDSLGAPAANAAVIWVALFDSAGLAETRFGNSDAEGEDLQVLAEGPWLVTAAAMPPRVAGGSFVVSGAGRAAADTQVVRIVLHTGSRASGVTTLAGRSEHSGTVVSSEAGAVAVTDSTGAWTIGDLPLGRWTLSMYHFGFQLGSAQAIVTTPGSQVVVPAVSLVSSP
jgi:hypothetical protein